MNKNINGSNALREMIYIPARKQAVEKIKVAGYARVSSTSDDQINSLANQLSYYTNLIENEENYEMVDIYVDEGISGVSLEKRTEFLRMMEDAKQGKIDRIITKSLSRFSRNSLDGIICLRELKSLGIPVIFEKEGINTDNLTSENLLTLYTIVAEQESINISQNLKKMNRERMRKGEYIPSNAPFGYRLENKEFKIYEPEAEIVRRIFKEYLSGSGVDTIVKKLNEENIKNKNNVAKWRKNSVSIILKNEKYAGNMLFQKTFNEDIVPYIQKKNRGELQQYFVKNTHPAIISEIEYQIVKLLLENKKNQVTISSAHSILNGMIKCDLCGSTFRKKISNEKIYWVCRDKDNNLFKEKCFSNRVSQERVFEAFVGAYNKFKKHNKAILLPMLSALEKVEEVKYKENLELKEINLKMAKLVEQNLMMTGLISEGILDSALFIQKTDDINAEIKRLKKHKTILLKARDSNEIIEKTNELIEIIDKSPEYITDMDEDIFIEIIKNISVGDDKTIKFHLINELKLTERIVT
ncbi:MAG: recombinase family protein [Clostridia bacterium]